MIVGIIAVTFMAYVVWLMMKRNERLTKKGFFADNDDNNVPDGIDKGVKKLKSKVKKDKK